MTGDSANPFSKLADMLSARKDDRAKAAPAGEETRQTLVRRAETPGSTGARKGKKTAGPAGNDPFIPDTPDPADSEDAALFMRAVSTIKPLGRGKSAGRETLGEVLAAKMKNESQARRGTEAESRGAVRGEAGDTPGHKDAARRGAGGQGDAPCGSVYSGAGPSGYDRAIDSAAEESEQFYQAVGNSKAGSGSVSGGGAGARVSASVLPDEDRELFTKAMNGVAPVNGKGRDIAGVPGAGSAALAQDPAKALRDILDGKVEFALQNTGEYLEGFVVGVYPMVMTRLRAGQYSPEKHLDLHGMNATQASDALTWFIKDAYQKGLRTVVVVTGRGKNSPDGVGVLRPLLTQWLCREPFKRVVLAFCTARPHDGGPGALYVLLRKYKKSRGKIVWERLPGSDLSC